MIRNIIHPTKVLEVWYFFPNPRVRLRKGVPDISPDVKSPPKTGGLAEFIKTLQILYYTDYQPGLRAMPRVYGTGVNSLSIAASEGLTCGGFKWAKSAPAARCFDT